MSREKKYTTSSPAQTTQIMQEIAVNLAPGTVVTFAGDLGAGKTTSVGAMLTALELPGPFASPTFTIIEEYLAPEGSLLAAHGIARVYHIDAYRIDTAGALRLGIGDMIADPEALTFVEWAENIVEIMPRDDLAITITHRDGDEREISVRS